MSVLKKVNKYKKVSERFTFANLEMVDEAPKPRKGIVTIYNGFPPDVIQRMDITEERKAEMLDARVQRTILSMLLNLDRRGKLKDRTPNIKALKKIDESSGREVLILFVTVRE